MLPHVLQGRYVLRQQEGLFQGVSHIVGIPPLELLDGRVPRYGCTIYFQPRVTRLNWGVHLSQRLDLLTLERRGPPFTLGRLGNLGGTPSSKGITSHSSVTSLSFFLFLRLAGTKMLTKGGGGGGRVGGTWDPEVSLGIDPLALPARSLCRPFFLLSKGILSSSSELLSMQATMSLKGRTTEDLSNSSPES